MKHEYLPAGSLQVKAFLIVMVNAQNSPTCERVPWLEEKPRQADQIDGPLEIHFQCQEDMGILQVKD